MPTNIDRCSVMPHPTQVPMITPEKELEMTKMKASQMNSFIIFCFGTPIERNTEISLTCSYRFPVIDDDKEKKQMNIVIAITTLNIISSVCSAYKDK